MTEGQMAGFNRILLRRLGRKGTDY